MRLSCPPARARKSQDEYRQILDDAKRSKAGAEAAAHRIIAAALTRERREDPNRYPERDFEG